VIGFLFHPDARVTPGQSEAQLRAAGELPGRRVVLLITLLGAVLRLPGLFTDFWLDEIWSYDIAQQVHSIPDVLLSEPARIDNNHPLNTLYLRAIGPAKPFWLYRLPSFLAGVGSIVLAARIMRRAGRGPSVAAALMIAVGYPFVFYSSEARGYAPAVFFALLAFESLLSDLERPSVSWRAAFAATCILGVLWHLTFVQFYLAAMTWSVLAIRRREKSLFGQVVWWASLHVIPLACFATLYQVFIRHLTIGGAPDQNTWHVLISSVAMPVGAPEIRGTWTAVTATLIALVVVVALVIALSRLACQRSDLWLFYVLAIVVAPAFLLTYDLVLSARPQPLMVRYFLVSMAFAALALSRLAHRRLIVVALVVIGAGAWQGLTMSRGGYCSSIARIGGSTVAADSAFRVGSVIRFYNQYLPADRRPQFLGEGTAAAQAADWYITTRDEPVALVDFSLDSTYPSNGLSGTSWRLHRRAGSR
jgi:hypothetical protein